LAVDGGRLSVLLTFDFEEWEGRGRIYEAGLYTKTKRVVDLLKEYQLPATFFLDAETTVKYPDATGLLHDTGFELALHSDYHFGVGNSIPVELDFASQRSEQQMARMRKGIGMIRRVLPKFNPKGFRSPGLRWNEDLYVSLRQLGFKYDSSQQNKFAFQPFMKNGVVVLPVNCGDFDSACYKMGSRFVLDVWKDNFLRACKAASQERDAYYMLLAHPSVCGKYEYIGMLKAMLRHMAWRRPEYQTCGRMVAKYLVNNIHTTNLGEV